ncbi:MAG: amino acid adenylation domain-containing protein, partial [Gordonia sp. (in: high G+C Gram-positive bacteria)]
YMVPSVWVVLDDFVLNTAGKIDRKALPVPAFSAQDDQFVAPLGDTEQAVAQVFGELLGIDQVSATASFLELGGNSLSAMRLVARVGDTLNVELTVRDLFGALTVRELAAVAAGRARTSAPIARVDPRPERIPLSLAQQRMWFINRWAPELPTYNIPAVVRLSGRLEVDALRAAVVDVLSRHEILRTTFPADDGRPHQKIWPVEDIVDRVDWRVVDSQEELETAVTDGFDVTTQWPLRVRLWPAGAEEHVLAVVVHHIGADGESMRPLVADLVTAYGARAAGRVPGFAPLEVQFADFALWQRRVLGSTDDAGSVLGKQLEYWSDTLAGAPAVLELPSDRPRPAVASLSGGRVHFEIPAEVAERVIECGREAGATPFMVVHAALAVLLARLSDTDDILIGTPIAGRGQRVLDPLVGMFVNSLLLRARVDSVMTFQELLGQIRARDIDAFAHADVPFEAVVEAVEPVRSEAFAPLAQVWLSLVQEEAGGGSAQVAPDLAVESIDPGLVTAKVDLQFTVAVAEPGMPWPASAEFATDMFDAESVAQFAARLCQLLGELTSDPSVLVGDVPLLTAVESAELASGSPGTDVGSATPSEVLGACTLADLLPLVVRRRMQNIAITAGSDALTFGEFESRVAGLAQELIESGVGPDVAVALCTPRSVAMIVGVHAVIAAGGQFVPIAVDTPAERAMHMMRVTAARVLLTATDESADPAVGAAESLGVRVLAVESERAETFGVADLNVAAPLLADHAAYTIFTSGSTGLPKGVTVSHRAVLSLLRYDNARCGFGPDDVFLQVLEYTFDPSVLELFRWILSGGRLVLMEPGEHRDPWAIARYVESESVTSAVWVPSVLAMMTEVLGVEETMPTLRTVATGGEALTEPVVDSFLTRWPHITLSNQYGPTESTIYATFAPVPFGEPVAIGRPVRDVAAYVLDKRLNLVPAGVAGELYLGGIQTARGYAGQERLTAERFVADPFGAPGSRLYRTGDLVRWRADGQLEYLGRNDFQVKIRGQRMEPEEIEAVLAAAPRVVHAAVIVVQAPTGGEMLVGYVSGDRVRRDAVEAFARGRLLPHMRPSLIEVLDEIPLSSAGKVNRRALPAPEFGALGAEYVAPGDEDEASVAAVFAEVVGADRVSVTESFFDLGGNSLTAVRLIARVSMALDVEASVRDVFEHPTVRELVEALSGRGAAAPPVTVVQPRPAEVPLSFAQQRMWALNQMDPRSNAYNIPMA